MITCRPAYLVARCLERGYTLDEVRPCIVKTEGGLITVDETHPNYPRVPRPARTSSTATTSGPGTELKALLARVGIKASPGCSCNKRAKTMDENEAKEPGWCAANIETICDWLAEESAKRKLPFVRLAGKVLINLAIRRAKKKGNSQ